MTVGTRPINNQCTRKAHLTVADFQSRRGKNQQITTQGEGAVDFALVPWMKKLNDP